MANKITRFLGAVKRFILKHKIISTILILCIIGGVYMQYQSSSNTSSQTRYILAAVAKGTINSSVSGTGQVSATDQLALSPGSGASGEIVYLNAVSGQKVSKGALLLKLDTTNAEKTIRDAESNLQSAQIALQKMQGDGTLAVPLNKQNAIDALNQDYQAGYNTVSSVFTDLPTIMTDLQNVIYGNTFTNTQQNIDFYTGNAYTYDENAALYKTSLVKSYQAALDEYTKNFNDYKSTTRYSDNATVDSIINETYNTSKDIAQAVKDTNNLIQFYKNTLAKYNIKANPTADTQLSTVNSDSSKINSDIINLLNAQNTIKSDKDAITNSDLDLQSQKLTLQKSQNSLQDAKDALSNYYIYAPFDGVVGAVSVQKGDTISSGTSAITFITQKEYTTISLSEIDVTKIKMGNKAVLTFDAIDGLTIAGQVTEIDTIGTVSQGVVSYNVKITFDTQDSRIKPGMSVSANVITETRQDVLVVPNSAVKSKNGSSYVLVLDQKQNLSSRKLTNQGFISVTAPLQKTVQTGISDSVNTEITSGLSEGDQVVVRTITGTSVTTAATTSSARTGATSATRGLFGAGGRPPGD
ncbi:MAG: efflux RND transporter periplasmic adaptor subunit [Candidatus Staskawiczbacteria bacterium]|nr:efflux RND transporter periplasmic adaptor subunit [Candidatus Staskawiczbacteria bacterium]